MSEPIEPVPCPCPYLRPVSLPEGLLLAAYAICLSAPQPGAQNVAAQLLEDRSPRDPGELVGAI